MDIKIPTVGESVQEAVLAEWFKQDGDVVEKDEPLFVLETDKVTLEVTAEVAGTLTILVAAGETVAVGAVVARIEPSGKKQPAEKKAAVEDAATEKEEKSAEKEDSAEEDKKEQPPEEKEKPSAAKVKSGPEAKEKGEAPEKKGGEGAPILSPAVRRLVAEKGLDATSIAGTGPGGRITKGDVLLALEQAPAGVPDECVPPAELGKDQPPAEVRKAMSPIRKRIAARLLEAKQNTAMLTTFNDIDMSRAMALRAEYKEAFKEKHDISLGFMSFFVKASVAALQEFPEVNGFIDGSDIVYHNYQHIGVAVGTPRGLVVPVIRHAERMGFARIEKAILDYVAKIKENRLELADLEGGTFTISNGGVYGSMLSTPILNMPQSGILGMHRIEKRPVVVDDEIVIRPMMYVALSYDHRIVDGREAVTFLKRIKELVENPERLLLEV
ncbi:2-oxoglutarate dehydrogenase complex dihydrolipoyllysine-residue succinyltransferase [Desulfatitalea alkaliphila]|uniref:Dihydrolipoyllysine-residue succinyltransferase component of 2-oxoglutarate dehydrogenase complex n=1 Tax=Desulfatitalea alkaliphila TaxID=2929485 RepID=A0AA41UL79_9BACT|nr:2-oxoglutarate dehydrogenase complex dihydrolipoyllysine-residue succinyltransferase [Desulfatitalea alkaliphila]MCJ8501196.1 2-oxoglutarate dehydrogenase complex dihydrolipoyllysine-residue succinyltransferase [Desulfatitalea alkaliphila]